LRDEFGRASFDIRHRAFFFGSITLPWQVTLNPMMVVQSGGPFNIITGVDRNGDTISNERPAFATDLSRASVKLTKFGAFDLSPLPGAQLIPRNFGEGPGSVTVNLRVGKTFGFGQSAQAKLAAAQAQAAKANGSNGKPAATSGGPNAGGPQVAKGGPMPMGGGPPGAMMIMMGGGGSDHPYNLTISLNASNIFNHVNPGPPVGNLSSPLFGQSTFLGGGGIMFGGGGGSAANNRRVDMQLMFRF
jgi:hypothetical protein